VQGQDVRVLELGGDPYLSKEAVGAEHGGELRPQHLDRDLAVVLQVGGEKHYRHPALTELAIEPVTVGDAGRELFEECRHPVFTMA
jgi:hypothetical protein